MDGSTKPYVEFSQEIFDKVCEQLSEGLSLRTVCSVPEMPSARAIYKWLRLKPELVQQYARAKEDSSDALIEDMLDIADDGSNDLMTIQKGNEEYEVENKEVTNRSKLRVDTRKWIASKLKPKKYGDVVHNKMTDGDGKPLQILFNVPRPVTGDDVAS
jgi:hypothetical protein